MHSIETNRLNRTIQINNRERGQEMEEDARSRYYDEDEKGAFFATWVMLHGIADSFPANPTSNDKEQIRKLFCALSYLLPCNDCNRHLQEELQKFPVQCETGPMLSNYIWQLHNRVNARLGHPQPSFEEAEQIQSICRKIKWSRVLSDLSANPNLQFNSIPTNLNNNPQLRTFSNSSSLSPINNSIPNSFHEKTQDEKRTPDIFKLGVACVCLVAAAMVANTLYKSWKSPSKADTL